jgi:hypothetical protein
MRIRIVSYEDINAWILGKFARRLCKGLQELGVHADISNLPDPKADVNHHIIYTGYDEAKATSLDTLMITHIDDIRKLKQLSAQMKIAKAGICMSKSVMNELVSAGLPGAKMLYINPAHDGNLKPEKIVIGITSKVQPDGCKREYLVEELFNHISPDTFSLSIMGAGWSSIVEKIKSKGFIVKYEDEFDYEKYTVLVPSFDYYLYTGLDEGSMGFIDALAAGVKTVVTPQGYHLDPPNGIVHAFTEQKELIAIFKKIEQEKKSLQDSVSHWTWKDYAIKHFELWKFLLDPLAGNENKQSKYTDGINSMFLSKERLGPGEIRKMKNTMRAGAIRRTVFRVREVGGFEYVKKKIKDLITGRRK